MAFAADASARIRGAPSVLAVTYGAGALNVVNAIAGSYAEKAPVVVVSGAPASGERTGGLLVHHQAKRFDSQLAIFREITCDQACLDDPARAPAEVARVLASARRLSRPVYLEVPRDLFDAPCAAIARLPDAEPDAEAIAACADEVLARLAAARRPVLMVGVEVRRFGLEAEVARLARTLAIPVVTSFLGRGLLASSDAPLAGTYLGAAGDGAVSALVEESDALLLLGVIVSDTNFGVSPTRVDLRHAIHALDGCVRLSHHAYPDIPLGALVTALLARAPRLSDARRVETAHPPHGLADDARAVTPVDIAAGINDLMAEHGRFPVSADVGDSLFTGLDLEPTDYVAPGYYATMGFAVPAALGIQATTGRRPLVLVGDGAFQMTGWELGHCRRYGWDPIVVVLNNSGWRMLSAFRPGARYAELGTWDFAACANALGGRGWRIETRHDLQLALGSAASDRGQFHLLDVRLAPDALSETLRRFAGARAPQATNNAIAA
ncbi:Indole-3-pyruvate decarboxylase [Usitatibacter palustris]|uniref:Indole-3-pyruvate decarboxylase n=1 Tax=Usitatibacter palustris TaxID=2732487 RepID=A0A6M4H5P8_9PROT|nr:Indole-3-pyruvate decarboxylase [Usitatibacter palustris]